MAIVNRNSIFAKVRRLTGSADIYQLPDFADPNNPQSVGIADYVNSFYSYDLPSQFRSLKLKDKYTFNTIQGIDTYQFNSEQYSTVEMPCYCAKREIKLFNDPWSFYGVNFNWQTQTNFTYGNGGAGPYGGYLSAIPLIRSVNNNPTIIGTPSVVPTNTQNPTTWSPTTYPSQGYAGYQAGRVQNILITANTATSTVNVTDDGNGNLIGDCVGGGTINYMTGQIANLTFTQVIPGGNSIQCQYNPVQPAIPLSIMFFQNQFTLRPVPNQGYTIELTAYRQPTQAMMMTSSGEGTPELSSWWEMIAFGAAKKIYEDRLDPEGVALMDKGLKERYDVAYTATYAQLGSQRISTIYADQLTQNYGGAGWFGASGSN